MRINNTTPYQNEIKNTRNQISSKGGREIIRTLSNSDSLMTTVVLESFVTGGRSANALKRGGFPEFRECFTDNVLSAVFWMKGVDIFNKIGDAFGKNVLNLPTTEFDVGKDALRAPFKNLISDLGKDPVKSSTIKGLEKKLAIFKFTKIIISTLLATGFVGFALPKINQAITRKMMKKKETETPDKAKEKKAYNPFANISFEQFEKLIAKNNENGQYPTFRGIQPELLTSIAHNLESQPIVKMLTNDLGILSGRVVTARNPDEGIEYLFRDAASSFFYFASTPLMYKGLQCITKSSNITNLDPVATKQVTEKMLEQLKNADGTYMSMPVKEFTKKTIGTLGDKAQEFMSKLPFSSDVISLDELKNFLTDEKLIEKATKMAKLQPEQAGVGGVLTKQQVADVLKNGNINSPEFMQKVYKSKFGEALTDPYKYISMKKITKFRTGIDKYAQAVVDAANKTNGGVVDKSLLEKINRKSYAMSSAFRIIAIAFSALALGVIIPKLQYKLTEKRTGSNAAPGLREFQQTEQKQDK
ncbi:hypothetical protein IJD44_10830 [bacterium]|nr:hypothetical protein [bacterium]